MKSSEVFVPRISDFNTTGLAEPFSLRAMTGRNTLTKIAGGAIKSDDKGEQAAQAVAKPVSFELDAELIDELIENFLVAVHRDKLRVIFEVLGFVKLCFYIFVSV